jgi:hypothetical protein
MNKMRPAFDPAENAISARLLSHLIMKSAFGGSRNPAQRTVEIVFSSVGFSLRRKMLHPRYCKGRKLRLPWVRNALACNFEPEDFGTKRTRARASQGLMGCAVLLRWRRPFVPQGKTEG